MYYNTTNVTNHPQLTMFKLRANSQDKHIIEMAQNMRVFSASKIFKQYPKKIPITSVRRSLNTLMNEGLIVKTGNKVMGLFSRKEFEYKVL